MARFVAPAAGLLVSVLAPLTRVVQWLVDGALHLFGVPIGPDPLSGAVDALRGSIELHAEAGAVDAQERFMLGGILDLAEVDVGAVMTHRKAMETLDADLPPEQLLERVTTSRYSRFPVWRGDPDRIVGVLHVKDLFAVVEEHGRALDGIDIATLCSPPWFVPDTTRLGRQLVAFRRRRQHLALVVDEYGGLEGLVTLEDVIEEIVGQIADETDVEADGIEPQADGSVLVSGWVTVRDLNRHLDWKLPDEPATTVAGLLIHEAERIPAAGESLAIHGCRFEVLERQRQQIVRLRIARLVAGDEPGAADPA
jgi:Mg2+/Co2+ transporter CorB